MLHVADLVQNSLRAGASLIQLIVTVDEPSNIIAVETADNGSGMTEQELKCALTPAARGGRSAAGGLGLPVLAAAAERSEGRLSVQSEAGKGTTVRAEFRLHCIDRPPLGDFAGTMYALAASSAADYIISVELSGRPCHRIDTRTFTADTGGERVLLQRLSDMMPKEYFDSWDWRAVQDALEGDLETRGGLPNYL